MANVKISELTAAPTLAATDQFEVNAGGTSKSATAQKIADFLASVSQTLTQKTFDTAGAGNSFKINGTAISAVTGTGSVVLSASPTLTGTLNTAAVVSTVADGSTNLKLAGATGKLRLTGYNTGVSYIDSANAAENAYTPLTIIGNPLYLAGNGATVLTLASSSVTVSQPIVYGGVTLSNSVTGTGSMVLSASPTLSGTATIGGGAYTASGLGVGLNIGAGYAARAGYLMLVNGSFSASSNAILYGLNYNSGWVYNVGSGSTYGASLNFDATGGTFYFYNTAASGTDGAAATLQTPLTIAKTGGMTLNYALTYGGVTLSNSVTGTGSMVLSADPTITGTLTIGSGAVLKLGNAYVAGAPTATGYVTIKDSAGTTYKVLVST